MMNNKENKKGKPGIIVRIQGPVVDVYFEGELPSIYEALEVERENEKIILEVQFHVGNHEVKTLAFASTDGLARGLKATRTYSPIKVPVGKNTLGRIFNVS